jgi:multidrug efflux pump subunit AcrA (membrane-fusion protein)
MPIDPQGSYRKEDDTRRLGDSFADPNALDDQKLGNSFVEMNSSAKKKHHLPRPPKPPVNKRALFLFVLGVLAVFLLVFLVGYLPRHSRNKEIERKAADEKNAVPIVQVQRVKRAQNTGGLVVPGTTTPLIEAYVYARSNGYISRRLVDIGDHVRKGQLLAVIDSPDLDQQVDQARQQVSQAESQLAQQKAQLALATVTVQRYRVLVAKGVFSRQDGDQQETNYQAQLANVAAAQRNVDAFQANLRRTVALQSYERVTAPFDGVITARNVDVGALVSASGAANGAGGAPEGQATGSAAGATNTAGTTGNAPTAASPSTGGGQGGALFSIANVQRLRILVSVPEGYAASVFTGQHATVNMQELPGQSFHGDVTRTASAIDQNTRTLLTEVQVDNRAGKLLAGMYAVVTFDAIQGPGSILVPGDAIAIRKDRSVVALVADGKVRFQPVEIGRDYGPSVEITGGIKEGDVIVTEITDDVVEGAPVKTKSAGGPGENADAKGSINQPAPPGGPSQYGNQAITDQNMAGQQAKQQQKRPGADQKRPSQDSKSESKQ